MGQGTVEPPDAAAIAGEWAQAKATDQSFQATKGNLHALAMRHGCYGGRCATPRFPGVCNRALGMPRVRWWV